VLGTGLAAQTDAGGHFRIVGVPPGPQRISAQSPGHFPESGVAVIEAGSVAEIEMVLAVRAPPARGRLAGHVTREGGAAPVPRVYLSPTDVENAVRTDEDGSFEIETLAPGWREMRAVALGYEEQRFRVLIENSRTTLVAIDLGVSLAQPPGGGRKPVAKDGTQRAPPPPEPFVPVPAPADTAGVEPQATGTPLAGAVPIRFTVPGGAPDTLGARPVAVEIADGAGRRLRGLIARALAPGGYLVGWDGKDEAGRVVSPGFYRVRIRVEGAAEVESLTRTP
jgi:hypothetical protein